MLTMRLEAGEVLDMLSWSVWHLTVIASNDKSIAS